MSDPLDHLLSVDLGESSPLCEVFENESKTRVLSKSKKPVKKVRFADTYSHPVGNVLRKLAGLNKPEEISNRSDTKEVKGILKVIKNSNFDGHKTVKGWSKPSIAVPLTVKIMSSAGSETKSTDVPDESFTEGKSENLQLVATMDEDNISQDESFVASEGSNSDELNEQKVADETNESSPTRTEHESDNVSKGNDVDLHSHELKTSQIDAEKFDDELKYSVNALCGESTQGDRSKHLLEDEIIKISKELFVETVSQMEDAKSDDGSVKSEILLDRSFISTDIVNDILDAQSGKEKLFFQDAEKPVKTEETFNETEKNLASGDVTQSRESSVTKPVSSVDSRLKRPPSPHTQKLKRVLEESVPQKPTAKDLRTIVYSAWCTIKADEEKILMKKLKNAEKQTQESLMKEKSLKEASAMKAFLCWNEQKEKTIKLKKENQMKMAEAKLSKAQEDQKKKKEADLIFKAWKKKKDEELKEQARKQKLKAKREIMSKGQSEEMKKLDAAAAFNAWKSQKLLEFQRKEKESLEKKELETSLREQEKAERDEEALKAYELWLECKEQYDAKCDWRNQLDSKPPWSPPGRIT